MRRRRRKRGFALLLTLMLVLVAGALLVGLARRSSLGALECQDSVERLQRRWAVTSCQSTLLPRAAKVLSNAERGRTARSPRGEASGKPEHEHDAVPELRVRCELAGIDYDLVFTDEQAKVSVNRLLEDGDRQRTEAAVRRLVRSSARTRAEIKLRPSKLSGILAERGDERPALGAYGQVFESAEPTALIGDAPGRGHASLVTLWGNGKINLRRGSAKVMEAVLADAVGRQVVAELIAERDEDPYQDFSTLLTRVAQRDDRTRRKLEAWLTDESDCHGLWVVARGRTRAWYAFIVSEGSAFRGGNHYTYSW